MTMPLLALLLAYLIGATPSSYWIGRGVYGVDLRTAGSGNLGATNAYRVLGVGAAIPVVLLDVAKGWIPVIFLPRLFPGAPFGWTLGIGAAAVLGHVFSFWVGFRGGKGVATSAGVFLALAPWAVGIGLLVWTLTLGVTGYVSLGSILAALVLPIATALTPHPGGWLTVAFTGALALFVIWAHRTNIGRLLRGEEARFGRRGRGGREPEEVGRGEP